MIEQMINQIICGDALEILDSIEDNTIDIVLTDPPYFLDKMDNKWNHATVSSTKYQHAVKSLPAGMKFDREQGKRFYAWYLQISEKLYRVLKPGGFFFSFSSPRLYHRMTCAVEDAGFSIRDCFIWLYTQNQVKAMSLNHFIDRLAIDQETKVKLKQRLNGWKTPQIKSCFEPIVMAQKQYDRTFLNNILKYNVGLLNTMVKIGQNMFPANALAIEAIDELTDKYFLLPKPTQEEKGKYNIHKAVKPLAICEYLIQLSAFSDDAIILDPFVGSGTTAVAAKRLNKRFIGIDSNRQYVDIALKRLEDIKDESATEEHKGKKAKIQYRLFEKGKKYSARKIENDEGRKMRKYDPLSNYLRTQPPSITQVTLTFQQIEEIIGQNMEPSARKFFRAWDNTPGSPRQDSWLNVDFQVVMVDMENEIVKFRRI